VPASNDLRQLLQERSENILGMPPIGIIKSFLFVRNVHDAFSFQGLRLPEELQGYHTLVPIEPTGANVERRKLGNWLSVVYRALKTSDGIPYTLRRIESACLRTIFPLFDIE
jgi:PAB-dependent poly(A)-specific ribonuclease subunit 3